MRRFLLGMMLAAAVAFPAAAAATITITTTAANAPNGTHYKSGSPTASCTVGSDGSVTCASNAYTLGGVGNINATETLTATYTATVVCVNNGTHTSDGQHQGSFPKSAAPVPLSSSKNGFLTVTEIFITAPSESDFLSLQTCPNPNWTPTVSGGITLQSFDYKLTFAGFSGPYIEITGP